MSLETMHREDVKADLRKRFGTIAAFEKAHGLPPKSVNEVLRGRSWARVAKAIRSALTKPVPHNSHENSSEGAKTVELAEARS